MTYKTDILSVRNFRSGLVTKLPPNQIPDDAFSDCDNIELDDKAIPTKAKGQTKYNGTPIANTPIRGGITYTLADGTKYYVVACGNKLWYSIVGSFEFTPFQIGGVDLLIDSVPDVEIVQYLDALWIVNGTYPIIKNAGYETSKMIKISKFEASQITAPNVPSGGKYIIVHQERLFIANSIDQTNGLYWSEPFEPENWSPHYGLNYDFVGKDDGENITGIKSFQGYVFVGKPHNIYRYLTLGDITQWQSQRCDSSWGWLYNRTVQEFFGQLVFLSPNGVMMFNGNTVTPISEQIRDKILELPQVKDIQFFKWLQTTTDEFNRGVVPDVVDVSDNEIKQKTLPFSPLFWEQTSQAEFEAGAITNLATQGSADDTLQLPTRKLDTTTADFDAGVLRENINTANNEIRITSNRVVQTPWGEIAFSFGHEHTFVQAPHFLRLRDDDIGTFADGACSRRFGVRTGGSSQCWINIDLGRSLFVTKINLHRFISEVSSDTIYDKDHSTEAHIEYGLHGYTEVSHRVATGGKNCTFSGDFNINANIRFIRLRARGYIYNNSILFGMTGFYRMLVFELKIYDSRHQLTANFISRQFDTECMDNNFDWASFRSNFLSMPSGTSVRFEIGSYSTSDTGNNWDSIPTADRQTLGTATSGTSATFTPTIARKRFFKYRIVLTSTGLTTPVIYDNTQNFVLSGSWVSPKRQLGRVDTWRNIIATLNRHGRTLNMFLRTARTSDGLDTAVYHPIDHNIVPTNALTGQDIWAQFRADFSTNDASITAVLNGIRLQYFIGTGATQTLDYRFLPVSYGNLVAEITGGVSIQTKSSATDLSEVDWNAPADWVALGSGGVIQSDIKRFLRVKPILTAGANLSAIWLGGEFLTERKDLGFVPADWGLFEASFLTFGQTLTFWMRSAGSMSALETATFVQQTPGTIIQGVGLQRFIQIAVRINSTAHTQRPRVNSVRIRYFMTQKHQQPCSVVWRNNYWLNVAESGGENNIVYIFNKNNYWLKRTNKKNTIYFVNAEKLLAGSGSDGTLMEQDVGFHDENLVPVLSSFETKRYDFSPFQKLFRDILITSREDGRWSFHYSINDGDWVSMRLEAKTFIDTIKKVFTGLLYGKNIKFRMTHNTTDENFEFHGFDLVYMNLRTLNPVFDIVDEAHAEHWGYGYWGDEDTFESPYYGGT